MSDRRAVANRRRTGTAPFAEGKATHGRRRLLRLRRQLKMLAEEAEAADRFRLTVTGDRYPQLWIDDAARLEACGDAATFRFAVRTRRGWQVLLESDCFDMLREMARRYVGARGAGCEQLEMILKSH